MDTTNWNAKTPRSFKHIVEKIISLWLPKMKIGTEKGAKAFVLARMSPRKK